MIQNDTKAQLLPKGGRSHRRDAQAHAGFTVATAACLWKHLRHEPATPAVVGAEVASGW